MNSKNETIVPAPFNTPHAPWPPNASSRELDQLSRQRNLDISIKGNAGPIGELEQRFLEFMECNLKYGLCFNSGTSALLAAYVSVGIEPGDEVIGPALTYHAALSPLHILGATPRLVDVDLDTRCIDASKIEASITPNTKAITVVHQWGHPGDMPKILELAKKYDLKVIEDCSHAHGSRLNGKMCGTFGDVAVFSLQTNKAIYAGEGGILVTNHCEYYERAILTGHYRDRAKSDVVSSTYQGFQSTGFGLKLRMSPFNAIVALHSLENFPKILEGRRQCLSYLNEAISNIEYLVPHYVGENVEMGAWYGFKPRIKDLGMNIDKLISLFKAYGLEISKPSGKPLYTLPLYKNEADPIFKSNVRQIQSLEDEYPNTDIIAKSALSFPTFYSWSDHKEILDFYIKALREISRNDEIYG